MSEDYCFSRTERIVRGRLIAIVRSATAAEAEALGETLLEQGLDVLEIALTTPGALRAIEHLAARHPNALIGAGTVLDAASARLALLAGARFLVSPSLVPDVITTGHRYGAPTACGAQSPTEIVSALSVGADLVKLFPAAQVGPDYLRAVRAALPQAPIVPTGGIDAKNARAWLDAGAVALGVGHGLTSDPAQLARLRAALAETARVS
jgi:2-dehydro-3-deoxyphosphogluconate aldolase / (4S)-4-hydroxy-2-oxoglutarate aldolase